MLARGFSIDFQLPIILNILDENKNVTSSMMETYFDEKPQILVQKKKKNCLCNKSFPAYLI